MTQKIAVAIVHGIGRQGPDFWDRIQDQVVTHCESECGDDVVIEPVHWAPALQIREEILWERMMAGGPLDFQTTRRLVIDFLADALAYQPTAYDRKAYDDIHAVFARTLRKLANSAGRLAPLCIISHSLGSVITSNFVYDLQKPEIIPESVRLEMGNSPLERGETLTLLYTLGSPLSLWSLRFHEFGRPIVVPSPCLSEHFPGLEGEWINFYDRDDVVAFPMKTLNDAYATAVTADVPVNVGGILTHWNPLSHLEYWTDRDVVHPIADAIVRTWRAVNG